MGKKVYQCSLMAIPWRAERKAGERERERRERVNAEDGGDYEIRSITSHDDMIVRPSLWG